MKNLSRLLFVTMLFLTFSIANAQDANNPWAASIGVNAVNVYSVGENAPQGDYFDEFFNVNDHWNILPSVSYIQVSKYLDNGFSVQLGGSINRISKWGEFGNAVPSVSVADLSYYAVDGMVRYSLQKLIKSKHIEPMVGLGGGYTWIEEGTYNTFSLSNGASNNVGSATLNGSLGLTYWFNDLVGLSIESRYKHSFEDYLTKHFQHFAGVTFKFGGKDTDGDGIYDKDDACPDEAGLEIFNGCPDSDNDGIQDSKDDCPNEAGLAEFNGCPDSDGDGVMDKSDKCPTVAGLKSLMGCPDADSDGVADGDDKCPNVAGPAANSGCPWPDTDGDGILDKDDKCPNERGVVANNGCPEVKKTLAKDPVAKKRLDELAKIVYFNSGKDTFTNATYQTLDAITALLKEYPDDNFSIEGHTDSVGSNALNQKLSQKRADAVKNYLSGKLPNGFSATGFGEVNPISSNKTRAGRAENRRVEIKLK